ncbi:hypothetical protein EGW08_021352 [Elysia chlorotica]|uniref:Uncharacterized protein n=1 Tax=Elysia chlorotica TaxID=188477 RepID=A0A3S0ZMI9_ELYCH|nr:hypothetical protein EGW08_021352 [Elysia chlorotica]
MLLSNMNVLSSAIGIEPSNHNSKMVVVFDEKYHISFSDEHLKQFYSCLCKPHSVKCSFKFTNSGDSKVVTAVDSVALSYPSRLLHGDMMVCLTRPLSEKFDCTRTAFKRASCPKVVNSGFHRLELFDSSCRRCINLCWLDFRVAYNSSSSRAVPEEGVCEASKDTITEIPDVHPSIPGSPSSDILGGGAQSTPLPLAVPNSSKTKLPKPVNPLVPGGDVTSSPSQVPQNMTVSQASIGQSLRWEEQLPVAVWVVLGIATIVTAGVALALVLCRRAKQRGGADSDTDSTQRFALQLSRSSVDESSVYPGVGPVADVSPGVFFLTSQGYVAYVSPESDYCTIVDSDVTTTGCPSRNVSKHRNDERNGFNTWSSPRPSVERTSRNFARRPSGTNTYSTVRKERIMTSAADVPNNLLQAQREARTGNIASHPDQAVVRQGHVYCRLKSRSELPENVRGTEPPNYNVPAGEIVDTRTKRPTMEEEMPHSQSSGHYSLAKDIRDTYVGSVTATNVDGWADSVQTETHMCCVNNMVSQPRSSHHTNMGCCPLNGGSHEYECGDMNCIYVKQDIQNNSYFVLENNTAKCTEDGSMDRPLEREDNMQGQRGYFILEAADTDMETECTETTKRIPVNVDQSHVRNYLEPPGMPGDGNAYFLLEHGASSDQAGVTGPDGGSARDAGGNGEERIYQEIR